MEQMDAEQNEKVGGIWSLLTSTSAGTILDDEKFFKPNTFILGSFLQVFMTAGSLTAPAVSRRCQLHCLDGQVGSNREHFRPNGSTVM